MKVLRHKLAYLAVSILSIALIAYAPVSANSSRLSEFKYSHNTDSIAFDSLNNLWVVSDNYYSSSLKPTLYIDEYSANNYNQVLKSYTLAGNVYNSLDTSLQFRLSPEAPISINVDKNGNVWILVNNTTGNNPQTSSIFEIPAGSPSSFTPLEYSLPAVITQPSGMAIDAKGDIWISNDGDSNTTSPPPSAAEFPVGSKPGSSPIIYSNMPSSFGDQAASMAIDNSGNVWLTDGGNTISGNANPDAPDGDAEDLVMIPAGSSPNAQAEQYTLPDVELGYDQYTAIGDIVADSEGNIWIQNGSYSIDEIPKGSPSGFKAKVAVSLPPDFSNSDESAAQNTVNNLAASKAGIWYVTSNPNNINSIYLIPTGSSKPIREVTGLPAYAQNQAAAAAAISSDQSITDSRGNLWFYESTTSGQDSDASDDPNGQPTNTTVAEYVTGKYSPTAPAAKTARVSTKENSIDLVVAGAIATLILIGVTTLFLRQKKQHNQPRNTDTSSSNPLPNQTENIQQPPQQPINSEGVQDRPNDTTDSDSNIRVG